MQKEIKTQQNHSRRGVSGLCQGLSTLDTQEINPN